MSNLISVNFSGNGTAYVDNPVPNNGDVVTLHADADAGDQINDIYGFNGQGYPMAFSPIPRQSWTYDESDGDITIYVEFSGTGPEPPTPIITPVLLALMFKKFKSKKKLRRR